MTDKPEIWESLPVPEYSQDKSESFSYNFLPFPDELCSSWLTRFSSR